MREAQKKFAIRIYSGLGFSILLDNGDSNTLIYLGSMICIAVALARNILVINFCSIK